jgi:hypothetical protein
MAYNINPQVMKMLLNTRFKVNSPSVICETMGDETILINLETGVYYSLEKAGAAVWRALEKQETVGQITDDLSHLYDASREDIASAILGLVEKMLDEKLIVHCADSGDERRIEHSSQGQRLKQSPHKDPAKKFERCELLKYTDMQELLLLDPIHEADESGWPETKPEHVT